MKKTAILLALVVFPIFAIAQATTIDKLITKYGGKDGVTVVNISPELFQIMSAMNIQELDEAEFPMDKLKAVKVLAIENQEVLNGVDFYAEVTDNMNIETFAEVMTVKDGDQDVRIWLKAEGQQIREFLLLVSSPEEGVVVYISGDFNVNDIEGLAQSFGGLEDLEALGNMNFN